MKEKIYFHNISHVIVSFCLFILTGRLAGFFISAFSTFEGITEELLRFIFAAACGILTFHYYEKLIPSPEEKESNRSVLEGRFKKRPFTMGRYILETIPHTLTTVMLLVISMYLVTIAFDLGGSLVNESIHTPSLLPFLSMVLIHPIAEEYMFRGIFYGKLRSMSPIFACLMQSVMFAISHNGVGGMMYALIAGILLGTAAERSNGIAVPVAAHIIINLRTFLYSGILTENVIAVIDIAVIGAGLASAVLLIVMAKFFLSYRLTGENGAAEEKNAAELLHEEADFDD